MAHGRLIEMGQLTTIDQDESKTEYQMALVSGANGLSILTKPLMGSPAM